MIGQNLALTQNTELRLIGKGIGPDYQEAMVMWGVYF